MGEVHWHVVAGTLSSQQNNNNDSTFHTSLQSAGWVAKRLEHLLSNGLTHMAEFHTAGVLLLSSVGSEVCALNALSFLRSYSSLDIASVPPSPVSLHSSPLSQSPSPCPLSALLFLRSYSSLDIASALTPFPRLPPFLAPHPLSQSPSPAL